MSPSDHSPAILPSSAGPQSSARPQSPADLENAIGRLVREALQRQLGLPASSTAHAPSPPTRSAAETGYRIADSVVSLAALEGLPEGTSQVAIGARAVVTPAAADRLRHRGVQIVRSGGPAVSDGPSAIDSGLLGPLSRWIADGDHPERTAGYARQLASRGISAAIVALPLDAIPAGSGTVGVVIADLPAIHVDHFARQLSLSAAAVGSLAEVGRVAAAMAPSVWVLDAERLSFSGRVAVAAECFRLSRPHALPTGPTSHSRRPR